LRALIALVFWASTLPFSRAYAVSAAYDAPVFQKGMCYVTWDKDQFSSPYSEKSLELLRDMGVEYVQVNTTQYQDTFNSTEIKATNRTPSDASVKHTIKTAHKLGLKTMLKPHIDLVNDENGSYWRADIGFYNNEDWATWFKEYKEFIVHYAKIAERNKVEIFCVGTELSFASQRTDEWIDVISAVKKVYSGKLVYAANWDNYKNIAFWKDLDYIGIDAYFPLSYDKNPTVEDMKQGWKKWILEIESRSITEKKPVIFTEIGYASTPTAPCEPWKGGTHGNADVEMQAKCYTAFFETVWDRPWLAGVYWWKWSPTVYGGGNNNRRFTPLNKPAAIILAKHYSSRVTTTDIRQHKRISGDIEQKRKVLRLKMKNRSGGTHGMAEEKKDRGIKPIGRQ